MPSAAHSRGRLSQQSLLFCLLQKCLTFNPAKRISAYGALAHPYFQDLERGKESLDAHLPSSQNASELNTA